METIDLEELGEQVDHILDDDGFNYGYADTIHRQMSRSVVTQT